MTDAQKFALYLPEWNRVSRRHGWKMAKKRLVADLDEQCEIFRGWPDPAGPAALQVVTFARQLAVTEHRGVNADDLRHACTIAATGKVSSKHLNNTETNRLVTLLQLLVEPDNIKAVTKWLHPEMAEREGMVERVRKMAPEGLLRTIFRNCYGTEHWEDGTKQQLGWLMAQVKGRQQRWVKPVQRMEPQLVDEPF